MTNHRLPRIAGFLPLSLVDFPGQACAVLFLQGCNLRCPYCHNPNLIPVQGNLCLDWHSLQQNLQDQRRVIDAVVITGGEPCMQPALLPFLRLLRKNGFLIKLDTNGTYPHVLESILKESLVDYIAMDFKGPLDFRMAEGTGKAGMESLIKHSMQILSSAGIHFEIRTTVHNGLRKQELHDMQELIPPQCLWVLQKCRSVPERYTARTKSEKPQVAHVNVRFRGY